MSNSTARNYVVRLAVISAVASAAWYFVVRPMRDRLMQQRATLVAAQAEISSGLSQIEANERAPESAIETLTTRANVLSRLWGVSADASVLYEQIDTIAHRYGVVVERMEPSRGGARGVVSGEKPDAPTFNEIGYSIELVGPYEGVARFVRAIQHELGMARIDSLRITPAQASAGNTQIRASVKTTHFQASGGLAAFKTPEGATP